MFYKTFLSKDVAKNFKIWLLNENLDYKSKKKKKFVLKTSTIN